MKTISENIELICGIIAFVAVFLTIAALYYKSRQTDKLRQNPIPGTKCRIYNDDSDWEICLIKEQLPSGIILVETAFGYEKVVYLNELYAI